MGSGSGFSDPDVVYFMRGAGLVVMRGVTWAYEVSCRSWLPEREDSTIKQLVFGEEFVLCLKMVFGGGLEMWNLPFFVVGEWR